MKTIDNIKVTFIAVFSAVSGWLGALAMPFYILVTVNVIDYITGIIAAARRGEKISSSVGFIGIAKKICMWLLVGVGAIVDYMIITFSATINIQFGFSNIVAMVVCFWLMANELISILENIHDVGVNYPAPLMKILEYVKEKAEDSIDVNKEE